jgi:hypothetical protein
MNEWMQEIVQLHACVFRCQKHLVHVYMNNTYTEVLLYWESESISGRITPIDLYIDLLLGFVAVLELA